MPTEQMLEISKEFIWFNINMLSWNKEYVEKGCNINGKTLSTANELTLRQFHTLFVIHHFCINTVSGLSETLHISKSSLSLTIGGLVKDGYLLAEKPTADEDQRKVYFSLTEKGQQSLRKMLDQVICNVANFFEVFSKEDLDRLQNAFHDLNQIFISGGNQHA